MGWGIAVEGRGWGGGGGGSEREGEVRELRGGGEYSGRGIAECGIAEREERKEQKVGADYRVIIVWRWGSAGCWACRAGAGS